MPDLSAITPIAVLALVIILTDRWLVRIFRVLIEHLERRELADQQLMLIMMQCSESLLTIKESLSYSFLQEDDLSGILGGDKRSDP